MGAHETRGKTDEHNTPWYVFEALGEWFDLDVAAPADLETCVPASRFLTEADDGLTADWGSAFVWCNLPFGHERTKEAWLARFFDHGNGIALTPDRTSAPWHQAAVRRADLHMNVDGKIKFYSLHSESREMVRGEGPGCGTTLWAAGNRARAALFRAASRGLGTLHYTVLVPVSNNPIAQPEKGSINWAGELAAARKFRGGAA